MVERVVLSLGGNVGDVEGRLRGAAQMLASRGVRVVKSSQMMETEPWGFESKGVQRFINQALVVETDLEPEELLGVVNCVEREAGREREQEREQRSESGERYASRKIDIDIITYGERVVSSESLTIPHPLMSQRDFVLRPMAEIAAEWRHPVTGRDVREMLCDLERRAGASGNQINEE